MVSMNQALTRAVSTEEANWPGCAQAKERVCVAENSIVYKFLRGPALPDTLESLPLMLIVSGLLLSLSPCLSLFLSPSHAMGHSIREQSLFKIDYDLVIKTKADYKRDRSVGNRLFSRHEGLSLDPPHSWKRKTQPNASVTSVGGKSRDRQIPGGQSSRNSKLQVH